LHTLQPRPHVFITGATITELMTNESIEVWETYVKNLGMENSLVINVGIVEDWLESAVFTRSSFSEICPRLGIEGPRSFRNWIQIIEMGGKNF
jgi:hypothetical protein